MSEINEDLPKLTKSIEDYIEVMYNLKKVKGTIRVTDIAEKLDVKPSSVVEAVNKISKLKLVSREKYGEIKLTERGIQIAEGIIHKHNTLKKFLDVLGVDDTTAEKEACAMEHILSNSTINKIEKFTEFIENCPEYNKTSSH
ncbi:MULTISPECIES: metal-dependent transcriptional regulator [Methanobacterium]|uniref:DtxR family transcriptional regulator n=1 Tax=Methanobacterium bryantii TaxID=2161 RepID=A0A2A2H0I4_METBR|nr:MULTISPECIES: metal-dependent transcriptional regulator [Methanobacterium]OEC87503.1 DtxR family transcriptional regulator [Methanobacterium sp. A39]PAV02911.1 DtxR family transcriptional regulator [Methanobacterium bryantii]